MSIDFDQPRNLTEPDQHNPGLPPASAERLCAWLNTLDGTRHDARPLWLKIGRTVYPSGAQYADNVGEAVIYLLGPLPASYTGHKHLFRISGTEADDRLWYVSGYFPGRPEDLNNEHYKPYHPFGRMFMLRRSEVPAKYDPLNWEENVKHRWLTHGDRGGKRPVMNIKRIWLDKPAKADLVSESHTINADGSETHTATFKLPKCSEGQPGCTYTQSHWHDRSGYAHEGALS